jgi:hypothetical protein
MRGKRVRISRFEGWQRVSTGQLHRNQRNCHADAKRRGVRVNVSGQQRNSFFESHLRENDGHFVEERFVIGAINQENETISPTPAASTHSSSDD